MSNLKVMEKSHSVYETTRQSSTGPIPPSPSHSEHVNCNSPNHRPTLRPNSDTASTSDDRLRHSCRPRMIARSSVYSKRMTSPSSSSWHPSQDIGLDASSSAFQAVETGGGVAGIPTTFRGRNMLSIDSSEDQLAKSVSSSAVQLRHSTSNQFIPSYPGASGIPTGSGMTSSSFYPTYYHANNSCEHRGDLGCIKSRLENLTVSETMEDLHPPQHSHEHSLESQNYYTPMTGSLTTPLVAYKENLIDGQGQLVLLGDEQQQQQRHCDQVKQKDDGSQDVQERRSDNEKGQSQFDPSIKVSLPPPTDKSNLTSQTIKEVIGAKNKVNHKDERNSPKLLWFNLQRFNQYNVREFLNKFIAKVDTINERYQADIFLQARWREPLLDATWSRAKLNSQLGDQSPMSVDNPIDDLVPRRHFNTLKLQDDEFWNPRLLLDNAQGEPIEMISHEVEFVEPDFEAYLVEKRRIKGVFHETLELRHFPFDCQDLSVTITCDRTVDEVELVPSPSEVSQVDVRGAIDSQEWKIFQHVEINSQQIQPAYSPGSSRQLHPSLVFTSRSARRSGYFMVNMILISCVLCLLSFAAFSVPADGNRLQLSLLLLLTTVTFKFAASQNLPKISYLTYLDKVVMANFFMLCTLILWHCIAGKISKSHPTMLDNESYVVYTLLACYCLGAGIFCLTVYLDAGSRRRMMQHKDDVFLQRNQEIERAKLRRSVVTVGLEEWLNNPIHM